MRRYNQIEEASGTGFGAHTRCAHHIEEDMWKMVPRKIADGFSAEKIHADERQRCTSTKIETVLALQTRKAMSKAAFVVTSDSHPDRPKPPN